VLDDFGRASHRFARRHARCRAGNVVEIAAKAGLNERYVREWLGAMVTGRIVDVDPATNRFSLPTEHAAFLTRAAGAANIGVFTQYISLLGSVEDEIVECFKRAAAYLTLSSRVFTK